MEVFYVDGQSVGNEQRKAKRQARIAVVYERSPSPEGRRVRERNVGDKTNNEAEYLALLEALQIISDKWARPSSGIHDETATTVIRSDSELVVNQINGGFKVKEAHLRPLWEQARGLLARLGRVRLEWVPREKNYAGLRLEGIWREDTAPL
jgi:ribonuclease HI